MHITHMSGTKTKNQVALEYEISRSTLMARLAKTPDKFGRDFFTQRRALYPIEIQTIYDTLGEPKRAGGK